MTEYFVFVDASYRYYCRSQLPAVSSLALKLYVSTDCKYIIYTGYPRASSYVYQITEMLGRARGTI